MPAFEPVLLARIDKPNSTALAGYRADGGYEALEKALAMAPDDVTKLVKDSGLRGAGRRGFLGGHEVELFAEESSGADLPVRQCRRERAGHVQQSHPDGAGSASAARRHRDLLAMRFARTRRTSICDTNTAAATACSMRRSTSATRPACLGKNILGTGFKLDVYLHRGAGAYICGEETGLIESLEGKRAWPRIKPPYPAIEGLFRKPTIVNNVETLCCVTHILQRGVEWFKSIGVPPDPNNKRDQGSYGPKLYCISGHVNKPCCVELPLGVTARELIDVHGGGVWKGRKAKAVVPGGISMGFLSANELDTQLDFEGPGKVGCLGLGTAAVVVIDDQTSMVDVLYNCCRFMSHESCGQCTPCREGTGWMTKILERIRSGRGKLEDIDLLLEVANSMGIIPGTTICGLADGAAWPVKNAITKFRGEFEEYIRSGTANGHAGAGINDGSTLTNRRIAAEAQAGE